VVVGIVLKNEEYIQSFVEEATIHVETVEDCLVNTNLNEIDQEYINSIFRAVHSIKGSAGFFNLTKIVELSHCMENLFGEIRNGRLQFIGEMVDILLAANDSLKIMVDDVLNSHNVEIVDHVEAMSQFLISGIKPPLIAEKADEIVAAPDQKYGSFNKVSMRNILIEDAISHGHTYYMIKVNLNEDLLKNDNNPVQLIENIKSIGNFVCINCKTELNDFMEGTFQDIVLEIFFTSVLQKSFLNEAINIPEQNVFEPLYSEFQDEDFMKSEKLKSNLIAEAIKYGQMYYMLKAGLNEELIKKGINPIELIQMIISIGKFFELKFDYIKPPDNDEGSCQDIILEMHFATVLQKDFLVDALNIPEKNITELVIELDTQNEKLILKDEDLTFETKTSQPEEAESSKEIITKKNQPLAVEDSIRVHVSLLNDLLNLASEMVLGRNQLLRAMEKHRKSISGIDSVLQNIDHITTELQEKVMQTRMQPISNVFTKFPRIIKELAKKLGKEMVLKLEGAEVELDKSIIESIGDPLTHLIRNAADHGLESPEKREKIGKPRTGTILMKAYHEGGYVNIDVIDDGAGINLERIKSKAIEKGLVSSNEVSIMGEQDILQLLFKPGFSTAEEVTDVSGRGVGMDVVKTNIEKLGGTIEIFTSLSRGTTFRLLLPLTLAIIPSLIVQVENQRFALPQVNLQEIVRIKPDQVTRKIEYINNSEVLRLRGGLLPIVHLADVLNLKRTYYDPESKEKKEEKRKTIFGYIQSNPESEDPDNETKDYFRLRALTGILRILVIKIGSRKLGIAVDAIHGSEEILVKPLSSFIKDCKCYSGVTIMGDGKTAMILDPEGIIVKANLRFNEVNIEKYDSRLDEEIENIKEHQNLLLFKCSGPETLAIDLSMVSRVEEIEADQIQIIGDKEYINFRQDSLRVIRPEDFLSLNKQEIKASKYYIVIPKLVSHPMGILIEKIHDTIQKKIILNHKEISSKGIVGSTIINDKIVLLINIYELFEMADPVNYKIEKVNGNKQPRVLLVEDTPFFQELERNYLEEAGYQVLIANHGKEALIMLNQNNVDAVVTDIQMPIMDGIELIKRIRADKQLANLPVMAVTSMTGDLQRKAGLEAGFDMYEFKLDKIKLLEALSRLLEQRENDI
jgi:two-component system chemotaxis sensor kinase CheA